MVCKKVVHQHEKKEELENPRLTLLNEIESKLTELSECSEGKKYKDGYNCAIRAVTRIIESLKGGK